MRKLLVITIIYFYICYYIKPTFGFVNLKSLSTSFFDTPARFSARINSSELCGALLVADPLDACSSLVNTVFQFDHVKFVLIVRGNCSFLDKVRNAQLAGFDGAIVFDDQVEKNLISMIGSPEGIWVPAVFVSNEAGETLMKHARGEDGECCIISSLTETSWNVLIISFISLLVILSVLAVFVSVRVYWRNPNRSSNLVGGKLVESLPCSIFNATHISGYMENTCAICLQDFKDGDSLKILPCQHKFHANCVGSWLTKWNTFCPVCKYDLKTEVTH
ncbi:receptor homology region, transmembrane domain- and RING domain-containing protein 1-like [Heracleum sosnowskyi]|uniref:RING-type E3 ubiquitin transferase n=1 Tax=Heracleum sosnowskyi TaxID=360622 RepID=A0AAD8M5A3_9APIA|nr:receptor homology region, transmembrane domain- and RING domain-containing protein 1-like [Heracleum sosnowskyi]